MDSTRTGVDFVSGSENCAPLGLSATVRLTPPKPHESPEACEWPAFPERSPKGSLRKFSQFYVIFMILCLTIWWFCQAFEEVQTAIKAQVLMDAHPAHRFFSMGDLSCFSGVLSSMWTIWTTELYKKLATSNHRPRNEPKPLNCSMWPHCGCQHPILVKTNS